MTFQVIAVSVALISATGIGASLIANWAEDRRLRRLAYRLRHRL
jgi:hypothetical protein